MAAPSTFVPHRSCPVAGRKRLAQRSSSRGWLLGLALVVLSCDRERPWDGAHDGGARDESEPWLSPKPDASWLRDGGPSAAGTADGGTTPSPSPVGGLWVSCYGGFQPSAEPHKDVARLGLLCGPSNGMRRLTDAPLEGTVDCTCKVSLPNLRFQQLLIVVSPFDPAFSQLETLAWERAC